MHRSIRLEENKMENKEINRIIKISLALAFLSLFGPLFILCALFSFFYMITYNNRHPVEINFGYAICITWICIGIGVTMTLLFTVPNIALGIGFLILFIPICVIISWAIKVSNSKDKELAWEYIILHHSYSSYDGRNVNWSERMHYDDIVFDSNAIITGDHYQPDSSLQCENYDHPHICRCCNRKYNCSYRAE